MTYQNPTYCQNLSVAFSHNTFFGKTQKNENSRKLRLDYYLFGMPMPSRTFTGNGYRFGFNGAEKENDIYGEGNASFFKYRISDNRLGRFFAVDPLAPEYPHNSPYAFSENRVIDGVELEGLEFVDKDEALLGFKNGEIRLKVENFSGQFQQNWKQLEKNTLNWGEGNIGIPRTIGNVKYKVLNPPEQDNYLPILRKEGIRSDGGRDARVYKQVPSMSSRAPVAAKIGLGLNFIVFALEQGSIWQNNEDYNNLERHKDAVDLSVLFVQRAIKENLIPQKYLNDADLSAITNVIYSGENPSENKDIYEIGMKIYNKYYPLLRTDIKEDFKKNETNETDD